MILERILQWSNIAYLVIVPLAAFAIYYLSLRVNAAKDRELEAHRVESNRQIAAAEARAAEANAIASRARLELAKLTEPRAIAPENQVTIIAELKQFEGQHFGFSVFPDPEPLALLRSIDTLLKSAGWLRVPAQIGVIAVDAAGSTAGTSHDSGVMVFVGPNNEAAEPALLALSQVLTSAGIPCRPARTEQLRDKTPKAIVINVGKKPVVAPQLGGRPDPIVSDGGAGQVQGQ